jgi:penicillin-binding protein 1A
LAYDRRHGFRGVDGRLDLKQVRQDPFEEELVEERSIGSVTRGVVKAVEDDKALVYLSDFRLVTIPFDDGIEWAREYKSENRLGPKLKSAKEVLSAGDLVWVENKGDQWWLAQVPDAQGAIVSINPSNGAVQALVGGFEYFHHKFNRAVQAKRQPGSNFKPFIYSAALEKGFTAASIINDAPVVFDDDSLEATWRPENYSGKFYGPTRLREALVKSRNLVSIRVLRSIGLKYATSYAERFGFARSNMPYDLSLALGSGTFSPLEIVRGYAVFANGGFLVTPYYIDRIESGDGELIMQHQPLWVCQGCSANVEDSQLADAQAGQVKAVKAAEADKGEATIDGSAETHYAPAVISPQNAYIMRSILREVVQRGTAVRAKVLKRSDIAGKTGTTNDQRDAWFSGFNDQVVTTTWVGFDDQKPLGARETGGRAALPMWIDFMREALQGMPINLEEQPENILTLRIDADTGERATAQTASSRFEIFEVGSEPAAFQSATVSPADPGQSGPAATAREENLESEIF